MIEAKVILDSIAPNGARLTTFELTYPRFIHAELMTHRAFSRNAASSRAVPTKKKIERIRRAMAKPVEWGLNKAGMQSGGELDVETAQAADHYWTEAGLFCLGHAETLDGLNVHKQVANRIIEPWDHITVVLSTTKLRNHFKLRLECDPATGRPFADPNYYTLAKAWKAAYDASTPQELKPGNRPENWHLPYVWRPDGSIERDDDEAIGAYLEKLGGPGTVDRVHTTSQERLAVMKKVSTGRCARVSYMRQGQGDVEENVKLHDRLASSGHWSPFEHVATPMKGFEFRNAEHGDEDAACHWCLGRLGMRQVLRGHTLLCMKCAHGHIHSGNFWGWNQYRKEFEGEAGGD